MEPSALIVRRACSLLTASRKGTQQEKGFLCSDREEMKRGSSSHGEQVLLEASKRQIPWTGYWNWKGVFQCLPEAPFGCVAQTAYTSAFLLFPCMEWVEPEEPRAGRKENARGICIGSCVIERPCSRRDRRCKQENRGCVLAFARAMLEDSSSPWESRCVCFSFLSATWDPHQTCWCAEHASRQKSLKTLSIRPRAFQIEHPGLEKVVTFSALQLAFCA